MKTFRRGGVHPPEHKELAKDKAIDEIAVPDLLYVSASQHTGAPAKPLVAVGNGVGKGQMIAGAAGYISANIHAPVSGRIKAIDKIQDMQGRFVDCIVIENDRQERWAGGLYKAREWEHLSRQGLLSLVLEAGIVGMGGAAFPTHVKLSPPPDKSVDTLVINGVECEPYLTCDHRLMLERAECVAKGIMVIKKILDVDKVIVGIEANKADAYNKMRAIFSTHPFMELYLLDVKYPQGAEKQLIDAVLRREVPTGGLPMDVGVVVHNVATAYAVYEAVVLNKPLIERLVTVSGDGVSKAGNFLVRIGTPIGHLLEACKVREGVKKVIVGGPMMGVSISDINYPVLKGTSGIVVMREAPDFVERNCIRCGKCIETCPMGIVPTDIVHAVSYGQLRGYDELHVMDCMECGSCAFVCPAMIPIVQYIKQAKQELAREKDKVEDKIEVEE